MEPRKICSVEKQSKRVRIQQVDEKGKKKQLAINFQVADVQRPLLSVKSVTDMGNRVVFSKEEKDCYIENEKTGDRLQMKKKGFGSYVLVVNFVGGKTTEITIDSAAEESVCPWKWGEQFGVSEATEWMKLTSANGSNIKHWGERLVKFETGV